MKVSIVTPSYNQVRFLRETIESVLNQDYHDIEFIVMDGGSKDGSAELIASYGNRIAYWESCPDKGQADAINKGFARASGNILSYLNSDDLLVPGAVSAIVRAFDEHPNAGVIYGATEKIDAKGKVVKQKFLTPYSKRLHKTLCIVPQPSSFYSRAAWERCGPFNASLHFVFDWDFLLRVEKEFSIVATDALISRFRVYETTKSSVGGWKRLEEIARIGRLHNGPLDYNFLVYYALLFASQIEIQFGMKTRGPLRRFVMKVATTLKDSRNFMVHDNTSTECSDHLWREK